MTNVKHDFSGQRIDDADFSGARIHGAGFNRTRITDAWFLDVDISGEIEGLRINGVDVGPLVSAELDSRFPERVMLRSEDAEGIAAAWTMIEGIWSAAVARVRNLPESFAYEQVDEEWSFTETLRHLILATDIWHLRMIKGMARPYHPWGLGGSFLTDPASIGIDYAAKPSLDDVVEARSDRMDAVRETIAALTPGELDRMCDPPDTDNHPREPHTVRQCLHVILNEEWEHCRYANRDLDLLEAGSAGAGD